MEKITSLLPRLVATITGVPRHRPQFEWSSSVVCNVFRTFEMIFGRRDGIRCEQVADPKGLMYSYTLENLLATYEGLLIAWIKGRVPKFSIVYVPQLHLAGVSMGNRQPYSFAIAFDVTTFGAQGHASPETWSHVVTGSNPNLLVNSNAGTDNTTAVSYNSVAMTKITNGSNGSAQAGSLWYSGTPATGSNTVSTTFSSGNSNRPGSISYSGCATTSDNASFQSSTSQASPINYSITSVADNCWAGMFISCGAQPLSAGTATTARASTDAFGVWFDSNAAKTPAGSISLQATAPGSNDYQLTGFTLAPFVAAAAKGSFLPFM